MTSRPRRPTTLVLTGVLLASCGTAAQSAPGGSEPPMTATPLPAGDTSRRAETPAPTIVGDLTGAPRAGDWPAYGFDTANSVTNRHETELRPDTVGDLVEAWHVDSGGVTATPVVLAGIVYFGDWNGMVHAVDATTGGIAWSKSVTDAPISSSATVTDDLVVVGDLAGGLHALQRASGSSAWSTSVNSIEASLFATPVVVEDMIVIGMTDAELTTSDDPAFRASIVAIDLEDGSERWRRYTDPDDSPGLWVTVWSSAAYDVERGLVYIGTGNTNQAAGPSEDEDSIENLPLSDGVLAIVAETGEIAWFTQVLVDDGRDLDVGSSPNLFRIGDRDVVGVGGKSGDYVVLDRDSGELIWRTHLNDGSKAGGVMQTAAADDGRIYVASNDGGANATVFALDWADGSIVWEKPLDNWVMGGSMALANGVVYRGLWAGGLVALDASTGGELWRGDGYSPHAGGAAVAHGMLFAGFGSGVPGALHAPEGGLVAWRLPD